MRDKWIMSGDFKQDMSNWHEELKSAAINLVRDEDAWVYDENDDRFNPGEDLECIPNVKRFKVVSNVGLELLTKAVCVKREIDIFKHVNSQVKYNSPFSLIEISCNNNQWLKSIFVKNNYEYLSDINTITFSECIKSLKSDLKNKPDIVKGNSEELLESIDNFRKFHRNIECHITLNLIITHDYETKLRNIYNDLLSFLH